MTKRKAKTRIPIHGPMDRPNSPKEGIEEMIKGRVKWLNDQGLRITAETTEFTSNCPSTGQPDFYKLKLSYTPRLYYIESKTLKFFLWSFRNEGYHCETLAKKLALGIKEAIGADDIVIILEQFPRGGIGLTASYILS